VAGEQVQQPTNGTSSRIFAGDAPRRPDRAAAGSQTEVVHEPIERDPDTGRFLKPGVPGYLVSRARKVGLTDDDLRDVEDVQELRDIIREREFEARIGQIFDPKRVAEVLKTQPGNGTNLNTPEARQPLDLGLNDEEDGPRLTEALTKLRDHYESRIDELEKRLAATEGSEAQRRQVEQSGFARKVESCFAKHRQIFGDGTIDKLDKDSAEFHFRLAAVAFHRKNGGGLENLAEDIDQFVANKFGPKGRRPARQQEAEYGDEDEYAGGDEEEVDEAEQWERGVLNRPTQAGFREAPAGREKAVQNLKRRLPSVQGARDARTPRGIYLNHGSRAQGGERQR